MQLQAADVAVAFIGGYHTEIGLMARAARDRGYPVQLVAGLSLATEEFGLIAGPAAEGTLFIDNAGPARTRRSSARRRAVPSVRFRTRGLHPVRLWRRSGVGAGGRESRLAGAPGDDRIPAGDTSSTPCWARSTSTRRATSLCKARYGTSGGAAGTCRWSKARPRNRSAEQVLILVERDNRTWTPRIDQAACCLARARSCSAWACARVCCWRSSGSARSR